MPADPLAAVDWGRSIGRGIREQSQYNELLAVGRFFLTTDRDGTSLPDAGDGHRSLMNHIQRHTWQAKVLPALRAAQARGEPSVSGHIQGVRISWRGKKLVVEPNPGLPATMITREAVKGRDSTPADIVDVTRVDPPLIDGLPASFMHFVQQGPMRAIIANLRPDSNPTWNAWRSEEAGWLKERFGELCLVFQYGYLPRAIDRMNEHAIAFSLGVRPANMVHAMDAARSGSQVEGELERAFADYPWELVFDEWRMNPDWRRRLPVFEDALRCIRAGAPGGAVAQLLAQIEGVITEYLRRFGDGLGSDGKTLGWPTRRALLQKRLRADDRLGPMRRATIPTVLSFLERSGLYEQFQWGMEPARLGRHGVLHGHDLAYLSHANAIRSLLALDALYWATGFQNRDGPIAGETAPGISAAKPPSSEVWGMPPSNDG